MKDIVGGGSTGSPRTNLVSGRLDTSAKLKRQPANHNRDAGFFRVLTGPSKTLYKKRLNEDAEA
jgi:hypothetical protein